MDIFLPYRSLKFSEEKLMRKGRWGRVFVLTFYTFVILFFSLLLLSDVKIIKENPLGAILVLWLFILTPALDYYYTYKRTKKDDISRYYISEEGEIHYRIENGDDVLNGISLPRSLIGSKIAFPSHPMYYLVQIRFEDDVDITFPINNMDVQSRYHMISIIQHSDDYDIAFRRIPYKSKS